MEDSKELLEKNEALPSYAAIDLGSNNCRMLMAKPVCQNKGDGKSESTSHYMEVVGGYSRPIRLGEGIHETGRLSPAAMSRARDVLQVCSRKIKDSGTNRIAGIATEACRYSENAPDFIQLVQNLYGLPIRIITPEEEANLAWIGCAPLVHEKAQQVIVFDIGGASTQLIYAQKEGNKMVPKDWLSIPEGVVTLHDNIGSGPFSPSQYQEILESIKKPFADFFTTHPLINTENAQIIGTSGTVTTLSASLMGLSIYRRELVDGTFLAYDKAHHLMKDLAQMDVEQRANHSCIGQDRADLVVVGCLILSAIWDCWPIDHLTVADRGLREGLLINMMQDDGYNILGHKS